VIIYCLDNLSFCQADGDGVITPIVKLADNKYHVVGEIIVAHEITMAAAVANLKQILAVCEGRKVFIITPLLRYINDACCGDQTHCTHKLIPDSATKLLLDLGRLHRFIKSRLSSFPLCEVIPAGDLLAAKHGASTSEILAAYSSWGAVHGSGAAYTRMALTLVDKVLSGSFKKPLPPPPTADGGGKRKRSESGSSSGSHRSSASSSRHSGGDLLPFPSRGETLATTLATTSTTPAVPAATAAAVPRPDAVAVSLAATALAPAAEAATTAATSLPSFLNLPFVLYIILCSIKKILKMFFNPLSW
jgi:hypothetical protein